MEAKTAIRTKRAVWEDGAEVVATGKAAAGAATQAAAAGEVSAPKMTQLALEEEARAGARSVRAATPAALVGLVEQAVARRVAMAETHQAAVGFSASGPAQRSLVRTVQVSWGVLEGVATQDVLAATAAA